MKRVALLLVPFALFAGQARYARLGEFDGQVEVQLHAADAWMPAERNLPLSEAAWVRTGASSRVEIELDDGSVWRLGPDSQGEISDYSKLSTGQRITLLSLDHGLAYFTGEAKGKDSVSLAVPGAQLNVAGHTRVRLEALSQSSQMSVLDGIVQFSSPAAEIDLIHGQTARVEPANTARFFLYREVTAMDLDRWSAQRDEAQASAVSGLHVVERYGLQDLDTSGVWIETEELGTVWRPKAADGWVPFQNGRWRWYGDLGYTWVSADVWGWLPYHYGRWLRNEKLGWIWAPSVSQVFKPGEVFWLRGTKFAAWGPLAPGEQWTPSDAPRQFLNVNTTYAAFQPDADVIDPAGFGERPKEPLLVSAFTLALPSPAFPASRLDALRPVVRAGSTRIAPVLEGVTFSSEARIPAPQPTVVVRNIVQPPVVIVAQAPPDPPELVPYAVPVYVGSVAVNSPAAKPPSKPAPPTTAPEPKRPTPPSQTPTSVKHAVAQRKVKDQGETNIYNEVVKDLQANNANKAIQDLDAWTRDYPRSDFSDERAIYYMHAFSATARHDKALEYGAQLMAKDLDAVFEPEQIVAILYLVTTETSRLVKPARDQVLLGRTAARDLLVYIPTFFQDARKPAAMRQADWVKARADMESVARTTLKNLTPRAGV